MKSKRIDILVLGAGPAGLSAAWRLSELGYKVTVLEKNSFPGGLSGSFDWNGHILDYGPHVFHSNDSLLTKKIKELYKDRPDDLLKGKRNVYIYLKQKMFHYPLKATEVLLKLNPLFSIKAIMKFLLSSLIFKFIYIHNENFESWGIHNFGKDLYNLCFGNYTEKVWKMPARHISYKFASEKVRGLNFKGIIKKMFKRHAETVIQTYWSDWIYPKYGSRDIYDRIRKKFENNGSNILLNSNIIKISHNSNEITSLEYIQERDRKIIECDFIISTIPIGKLINLLSPQAGYFVSYHASKLKYRSLILVYIETNKSKIHDAQWFYLLDKPLVFNRISEQKNLSPYTVSNGKNVLTFELTCNFEDAFWRMSDEELLELAKKDMIKVKFIKEIDVTDYKVIRIKDAYEVYDLNFDEHLSIVIDYISKFKNLISTGRKGLFLQGDMHDSIKMGFDAANFTNSNVQYEKTNNISFLKYTKSPAHYYEKNVEYLKL